MRIFATIFIALWIAQTHSVKFWEDYADRVKEEGFEESLRKEAAENKAEVMIEYPPYHCHVYRKNVLAELDAFSTKLKKINGGKSASEWIVDLFTNKDEDSLHLAYLNAVDRAFFFFEPDEQIVPLEDILDSYQIKRKDGKAQRWVDKAHQETMSVLVHGAEIVREQYDYRQIGEAYGRLLYDRKFVCFQVPELSLIIFRLFYFRIFEAKYIDPFFDGFFGALEKVKDESELSHMLSTDNVDTFFGYNLLVLLGVRSETADDLISVFDNAPDRHNTLIDNFKALYKVVLETVETAEHDKKRDENEFFSDLMKLQSRAVEKFARKSTFFCFKFFQGVVIGGAFSLLGPAGKLVSFAAKEIFESEFKAMNKAVKEFIDPEDKGVDEMTVVAGPLNSELKISNLRDFLGYFETQVANHKECAFCQLKLKDRKRKAKRIDPDLNEKEKSPQNNPAPDQILI